MNKCKSKNESLITKNFIKSYNYKKKKKKL